MRESVIKKERKKDREGGKAKVAQRLVATTAVKLMLMKEGKRWPPSAVNVIVVVVVVLFSTAHFLTRFISQSVTLKDLNRVKRLEQHYKGR